MLADHVVMVFDIIPISFLLQSSTMVVIGLGLAAVGLGARYAARNMPKFAKEAETILKSGKLPVSVCRLNVSERS